MVATMRLVYLFLTVFLHLAPAGEHGRTTRLLGPRHPGHTHLVHGHGSFQGNKPP